MPLRLPFRVLLLGLLSLPSALLTACSGGHAVIPVTSPNMKSAQSVSIESTETQIRYKVIDLGTFGGPISSFFSAGALNKEGIAVGWAATPASTTPLSHPLICGGFDGLVPFITVAFQWNDGVLSNLGALSPTNSCSEPVAINPSGVVAGIAENGQVDPLSPVVNEAHAVRWVNGHIEDLGSFGGYQNGAQSINPAGQIVGESTNTTPDRFSLLGFLEPNEVRAFLWQRGRMHDIGTLGGNDAIAYGINNRGQVVGISYTSTVPNSDTGIPTLDPFLWQNGKMIDLGTLGGTVVSNRGISINNRGQVVGASSTAAERGACLIEGDPNCHFFLWSQGKLTDLTAHSQGGQIIGAGGITDDGEIVGQAFFSNNAPFEAALWKNGKVTDLGNLGDCFSNAHDINSHDQIVGATFTCANGETSRAFLWQKGVIVDLNTLVAPNSPLRLVWADRINDHGEIVGEGVPRGVPASDVFNRGHAFVLIPIGDNTKPLNAPVFRTPRRAPTSDDVAAFKARLRHLYRHELAF